MKKIFLFLAFLFAVSFLFAQRPVGNDSFALQTVGSSNTFFKSKGAIGSDSGFVVAKFPDTVSANSSKLSHYPGAVMRTGNELWLRDITATNWIQLATSGFDTTTIYNILNQKLNIIDTVGLWQAQGIYLTNFVRLTDSTVRYVFNFGDAYIDDTSRISFTQENITNITNIFNYLDSLRGKDTTFIRGPTANGLPFAYSVNDPLSDNDTLHFYFPPNNIAGDSVLVTDVNGNLKQKLVTGGAAGWALTGNAGTVAGTNFLGTTDDINLMLKRNNVIGGLIDSNSTTTGKTYFGVSAGRNNTAIDLTAFGWNAAKSNTSGASNTAMGNGALASNVTTDGSTAFGFKALTLSTAAGNTAFGSSALAAITSVGSSSAFGASALLVNTAAQQSAFGYESLKANVSGLENAAFGYQALLASTSGLNSAFGWQALKAQTTGAQNTAFGDRAGNALTIGNGNVFVGVQSGTQLPAASASSFNTFVGGEYNFNKGLTAASSNNTIIGANYASPTTSLTSHVILTEGLGQVRFLSNANAQAGIRYNNPTAVLQLAPGTPAYGKAPLKFTYWNLTTTAASGTGAAATLTFAAQASIPFSPGDTVVVAGVTPAGYNGTWKVNSATTTTVVLNCTTTGAQTVAGTITIGQLQTTPEAGAIEYDGTHFYGTDAAGVRHQLDN